MAAKTDWADGQSVHGSDLNTLGTEVNGKQASDSDLTAIAALTPADNDVLQRKAGAWTNRTPTQLKTDLALTKTDVGLASVTNNAQYFAGGTDVAVADGGTGAGTAAGARTNLAAERAFWNNVKDFGAAGDGTTDDTTAITNALAAGGITFFPAGTYIHTGLTLAVGAHLVGVGQGTFNAPTAVPTTQRSILKLKNAANAHSITIPLQICYGTIENLEIDGNKTNQTSNGIGLNFVNNSTSREDEWVIRNVEIHDTRQTGLYYGGFRRALFVNRLVVSACGAVAVDVRGSDCTFVKLITGNHASGVVPLQIKSTLNRFYGGDVFGAIGTHGVVIDGTSHVLSGMGIDHHENHGIFFDTSADEIVVVGCIFHSNGVSSNNTYSDIDLTNAAGNNNSIIGCVFSAVDGVPTNKRKYAIQAATKSAVVVGNAHNATATATGFTDKPTLVDPASVVLAEQMITLTSTYTLTSQTAAQKLFNTSTNGRVTLPVGSYYFECFFDLSAMSSSSGSFGWDLTAGTAVISAIKWWSTANKAALATAAAGQETVNTAANTSIATANTTTTGWAKITGKVRISTAGTVIPQVSLGVAAAAVVGADSYFRIWPVGTNTTTVTGNWS